MNKLAQYLNQHLIGEVLDTPHLKCAAESDNGLLAMQPEMVVYPYHTNDVRKLLRFSWQLSEKGHQLPVTAQGNQTSTSSASVGAGIVAKLPTYMNTIYEYDAKQRLVRVAPGATIGALENALALQGVAIDQIRHVAQEATIGGMISTKPHCADQDEWISQLEVVLANGDVLQTQRLSKRELNKKKGEEGMEADIYRSLDALIEDNKELINNLPYESSLGYANVADVKRKDGSFDLTPLFVGAQGTLGIVTEMILRTNPLKASSSYAVGVFADAGQARDVLDQFEKIAPDRIEYFDGALIETAQLSGKRFAFLDGIRTPVRAVLVVECRDESIRVQAKKIKKITKLFEQFDGYVSSTDDIGDNELSSLRTLPTLGVHSDEKGASVLPLFEGVYVPLSRFEKFSDGIARLASLRQISLSLSGRPLDETWNIRPSINLRSVGQKQLVFELIDDVTKLITSCGGHRWYENGEGRMLLVSSSATLDNDTSALFEKIRAIFDPKQTLNTGVKQPNDTHATAKKMRNDQPPITPNTLERF